jgi:hypothetical protein
MLRKRGTSFRTLTSSFRFSIFNTARQLEVGVAVRKREELDVWSRCG